MPTMSKANSRILFLVAGVMMILTTPFSQGFTSDQDVYAINNLFVALGSPPLPGWIPNGGDPCLEAWQGVQCVGSNITSIIINGANLGGQLGDKLGNFTSIITIDLSNNNIGGSIPENLPFTMQKFFLSANQFTGSIPRSLSQVTLLSDMSVNENHLSGQLPDAFQSLTGLINLDLSSNNMSGQLPLSMESLSSLTTLRLQNNQLSGTLDVLQDLPLKDLNIENNLFSGPVPEKLLSIPNFKKDGNPFNISIAPSPNSPSSSPPPPPRPPPPPLPFSVAPVPGAMHSNSSSGPPSLQRSPPGKSKSFSTIRIIGYALVGVVSFIVTVLSVIFCISKFQERKSKHDEISKRQEVKARERYKEPKISENLVKPINNVHRAPDATEERTNQREIDMRGTAISMRPPENRKKEHDINKRGTEVLVMPPPPVEKVTVHPIVPPETTARSPPHEDLNNRSSVVSYSVASLQQYTDSFGEENLIKDDRLGKVYLAYLPDGKLLAVMKLDNVNSKISEAEFLDLVLSISELRHPNILELVGYCTEFGQRLLVYNYFSRKSLQDILHYEDDLKRKLSWIARLQVALGAAKGLEYLHEGCQPPVVHQDFEPSNILVNEELAVRVSECGLASLLSSSSVSQLSGRMRALLNYEAPEINESGSHSDRSDVYSFGVVMLELLTGRKPYDSSRPRAEQHLVRWASSQLHDINGLSRMVDPAICGKCPKKSLSQFADIISRCVQQGPEFRPLMSEVVQDLTRMLEDSKMEEVEALIRMQRRRDVN